MPVDPGYIEPKAGFLVRYRTRLGLVLGLAVLALQLFTQHSWPEGSALDRILDAVGYPLLGAGVLVRLWATLYIGGRKQQQLQCSGPYSLVRHPLYLGSLLLGLGFGLVSGNPLVLAGVLAYFCVQYRTTIRHEEAVLEGLFGEQYRDYKQRVPCFLPRRLTLDRTPPESINTRALRAELGHAAVFIVVAVIFEVAQMLHYHHLLPFVRFP